MNAGRTPAEDQAGAARLPPCGPTWSSRRAGSRPSSTAAGSSGGAAPTASGTATAVHGEAEIDDYDEQLDFGTRELACELKMLERANMKQAAEIFVAALAAT